jgi:cell wall-associated NlpC family hydrolase
MKMIIILIISLFAFSLNVTQKQVVACAKKQIGRPYVPGGTSPSTGFDCSGLAYYCHLPDKIGTSPGAQASKNKINVKDRQPGDLLFFNCNGRKLSHTVISMGGNAFIEAPMPRYTVRFHTLNKGYCGGYIAAASRYWKN